MRISMILYVIICIVKSQFDEVKDVFFKTQQKYHLHKPLQWPS